MITPRLTAERERYHLILSVWESPEHRERGGSSWRAATGSLTATGRPIRVTMPDGSRLAFPPLLSPDLSVSEMWSLAGGSVSVSLPWGRQDDPSDLDLRDAVGELALLDEASGGTDVVPWTSRRVMLEGPATITWGTAEQPINITIEARAIVDDGDFYPDGAELSSSRFADIASTDDRSRAKHSDGLLPPIVYAPVGSSLRAPCLCVQDEVDAVSGVSDLVPRRWLLGYREPTQTAADESFRQPDPEREGRFLTTATFAEWQATPVEAVDALGARYWYAPGLFEVSVGTASVTLTNALDTGTATRTKGLLREGWQIKGSTGGQDDYVVLASRDGDQLELETAYGGASVVSGTADVIPLPADKADGMYWIPALGGIRSPRGGALSQVLDVLEDWLRMARLSVPVVLGDLQALRSKLNALDLSWVCRERGSPWAKCLQVLEWLPVRPYLSEGSIRFRWSGPVTDLDVRTELPDAGVYRAQPIQWSAAEWYPVLRVRHWWDVFTGQWRRQIALDGGLLEATDPSHVPTGRTRAAWFAVRDRLADRVPSRDLDLDMCETLHSGRGAAVWASTRYAEGRHALQLDVPGWYRWLEPGDVVSYSGRLWTIDGVTWAGTGGGRLLLEQAIQ